MAKKQIDIRLSSSANLDAMHKVSTEAALMAKNVGRANEEMRQSTLRSVDAYDSLAAKADKAARGMGTGYKSLSDFLVDVKLEQEKVVSGAGKITKEIANIPAATKAAEAGVGKFHSVANGVIDGLGKKFRALKSEFLRGGIWGLASFAVVSVVKMGWDAVQGMIEKADKQLETFRDRAAAQIDRMKSTVESFKSTIADCASAEQAAIAKSMKLYDDRINAVERLKKAELELARQRRIAAGEDAAVVNSETNAALASLGDDTARKRAANRMDAAQKSLRSAESEKFAAMDAYNEQLEIYRALPKSYEYDTPELQKKSRELRRAAKKNVDAAMKEITAAEKRIEDAQNELDAAKMSGATLEKELQAAALKRANDQAAAEAAAAKSAAAERDRLDRELHKKRMDDLRAEIAAQKDAMAPLKATVAAAQSEFERAFAMYRSPDQAAAQIAEERNYAADMKRLHKDASRYGGKWRIDELSTLMSAGDTQGVQARLEDWRKSRSFSPQIEAMVRASAAEQTRTTAEAELRKIEQNTAGLDRKLDELLTMKGG